MLLPLIFTGCIFTPEPKVLIKYKIREVNVTKIVKEPVFVNIPDINCSFYGEGFEPTVKVLECVILQKRVLDTIKQEQANLLQSLQQ